MSEVLSAGSPGSDHPTRAGRRGRGEGTPRPAPPMTVDDMLEQARRQLHRLDPREVADAVRDGSVLVDVRTSEQRERTGAVPSAIAIPLNVLEWRADPASSAHDPRLGGADVQLIVMCAQGYCSSLAAARLIMLGRKATDVTGGFAAWRAHDLPVLHRTSPLG